MNLSILVYYGWYINVYDTPYPNGTIIKRLVWEGYSLNQLGRWKWYFNYRAALLQVEYPKCLVDSSSFKYEMDLLSKEKAIKNKLIGTKREITKWENILRKFESEWHELFSYTDYPPYLKAKEKVQKKKTELMLLENQLNEMKE